jgi:hypothetical protein
LRRERLRAHRIRAAVDRAFGVREPFLGDGERLALLVRDERRLLVRGAGDEDPRGRDREHEHQCDRHHEGDAVLLAHEAAQCSPDQVHDDVVAVDRAALRIAIASVAETVSFEEYVCAVNAI